MTSRKRSRCASDINEAVDVDPGHGGGIQDVREAGSSGKKQRVPEGLKGNGSEASVSDLLTQNRLYSHNQKASCLVKDDQSPFSSKAESVDMIDTLSLEKMGVLDTASLAARIPRPSRRQRSHRITPRSSMVDLNNGTLESIVPREPLDTYSEESDVTIHSTRPHCVATSSPKSQFMEESKTLPKSAWRALLPRSWSRLMSMVLLFVMAVAMTMSLRTPATAPRSFIEEDSVYVPGGGFSGFWFTLGRLRSIPDPSTKNFYCYSAGCLGVVATTLNYTMEETYDMALDIQNRWKRGEVDHFDVVKTFLDDLLFGDRSISPLFGGESYLASRLNIITTVKGKWGGLDYDVRKPSSLEDLHEMLLQTTWIPYATGADLWLKDHMDGAFTAGQHPPCAHSVGIASDLDLFANIVNVNLGRDKVEKFYQAGLALGL